MEHDFQVINYTPRIYVSWTYQAAFPAQQAWPDQFLQGRILTALQQVMHFPEGHAIV